MGHSGREELDMETDTPPPPGVIFRKYRGCFVTRGVGLLLAISFVSGLVATGLLVYYLVPDPPSTPPSTRRPPLLTYQPHITIATATTTTAAPEAAATTRQGGVTSEPDGTESTLITDKRNSETKKGSPRLPRALRPLHYLVKLQPLINGNFSILGYVEVEMEVLEATSNITLHIADIITYNDTIKLRSAEDPAGPGLAIMTHQFDKKREFYVAHLREPLRPGSKYVLSMHFIGLLNDKMRGFYRSSYRNANGTETRLAATQFQATDARRAFPCFDEPGLKATFEVHLARQVNMTSLSNMPIKETLTIGDQEGWVWDQYQTTVPMSTYLLAFVVSDFVSLNTTIDDKILFRVWARPSALHQASYCLDVGPRMLSHFANFFNQSYPLPKLDMVAIPDFAPGAMENWGLATYREVLMLYDPRVSAASNKQLVASVVAHELAHQWFGNLVTPRWWTDIWLNEGFASYLEYTGVDQVEPSWKILQQFVLKRIQGMFTADSLASSHPIRHNAEHADKIAYDKGSSIIRMMHHFLGKTAFRRGLTNYLQFFKYDNAEQDDLWQHLTEAAHEASTLPRNLTVKTIMDTWTLQMGYPVIKVERSADGTSATVSQERFLLVKDDNADDTHDYKWWVPLTYTGQDQPDFSHTQAKVWMKDSEAQVTVTSLPPKDQWVIFNLQQTGYYRVNYDPHNWNLLIQQLLNDHTAIATVNRAQIIDDALDLARAGQLDYSVAFKVFSYLDKEREYLPWRTAISSLSYVRSMFKLTGAYGALRKYMMDLVLPLYDSIGFDDKPNDPLQESFLRETVLNWACVLGHQPCLDAAHRLYNQWMLDPDNTTIFTPNVKWVVYCRAVQLGGEEEWNFAWNRYLKSNVASEKTRLLSAMGCTKKQWLLARYLNMAFNDKSGIGKQDARRVFSKVARNDMGHLLAWNYLRTNWKKIYDYFGGKAKSGLISSATNNFNTEQHLKEVMAFKAERGEELSAASRTVDRVVEKIKNNMVWMTNNHNTIAEWLHTQGYPVQLQSV